MGPFCLKSPLRRFSGEFLVVLPVGCLGNGFETAPLGVEKWDTGWRVAIEPEETFSVDLLGSAAYPGDQWRVAEFDDTVLGLDGEEYGEPHQPSGDPEATEDGEYDPGSLVARSRFAFHGVAIGQTPRRFELAADGQLIDVATYTVDVVEDACAAGTAAVANRCGGSGFTFHP